MKRPVPIIVRNPVRVEAERAARSVRSLPAARYVLAVLAFGAMYASFRPFTGWRTPPRGWLAFLGDPIQFLNKWDHFLNVVGYIPLGFLAVLALASSRRSIGSAAVLALIACTAFSIGVETLQSALIARTSSLVDVVTNVAGTAIGVVGAMVFAPWLMTEGGFLGVRRKYVEAGWRGDIGMALVAGWTVALLAPRTLLFGNGDARLALSVRPPDAVAPVVIAGIEAVVTTMGLLCFALLLRLMLRADGWRLRVIFLLALCGSLAVRATGFGLFWTSANAFLWVTTGAIIGLIVGTLLSLALIGLPKRAAGSMAVALIILSTTTVNLSPPNPYLWTKPRPTRQAELAPLSMTTRSTAMLWPFAALTFAGAFILRPRRPTSADADAA
jgi:VanZ family protein